MYIDALSFLEDERDAWRQFEALSQLTDDELDAPVGDTDGVARPDPLGNRAEDEQTGDERGEAGDEDDRRRLRRRADRGGERPGAGGIGG